jgi:hypothetical protein
MPPTKTNPDDEKPRRRWRWLLALLLLLFGLGGVVWATRPNPHLARARELQKELANAKSLPPDQRKARFEQFRNEVKQLTDDQKAELFAPMREKQKAEMDRYFAMSPQQKIRYLDDRIDRMEKMRKDREKNGGGLGGFGPGGTGGGPGARGPGGTTRTPEEIEKRRKQFLENTTPEERAKMDQFRHDLDARRRQRGLSVPTR